MKHRILLVDDDEDLLRSFKRQLRKRFDVHTAANADEGLAAFKEHGPFSIVISDHRMPGMTGLDFLDKARELSPDTVRILLTGYADLQLALSAVNDSNIFRLLTKPCPPADMAKALTDAKQIYESSKAEKELLQKTLKGTIKVLTDLVALQNPVIYGRISRIMPVVRRLSRLTGDKAPWRTETATLLSMLGYVSLPEELVVKAVTGKGLSQEEREKYLEHTDLAARHVGAIPRLGSIAEILRLQEKHFDGSGHPEDAPGGKRIPLAARILKAATDLDVLRSTGKSAAEALKVMHARPWYDPDVLAALTTALGDEARFISRKVYPLGLEAGMLLDQDLYGRVNDAKVKIASKGQELSETMIDYLYANAERMLDITEPIKVREPVADRCAPEDNA